MSLQMKKRQQERQRMNGLNEPVKALMKSEQSFNGWAEATEPMSLRNPRSLPCPKPAEKEFSIQSLLQHSCYTQQPQQQGQRDWTTPHESFNIVNELPEGAYFETAPVYVDEKGNPVDYPEKPTAPCITDINVEQQSRCINSDCSNCKGSMQAN